MPVRWSNAYRTARNTNASRRMARTDVIADRSSRRGLKMGYSSRVAGWRVIADMAVNQLKFDGTPPSNATLQSQNKFSLTLGRNFQHKMCGLKIRDKEEAR